ncbi:MAG: Y-family DNA polymerase [Methylococcales bacterium]|nr:MAG: Y-family DNA polymerase [Methylococcales bacterium]
MQTLIALVDCNNFYVSCERVFRPDLIGKPVAVLSNNDGCVVARSKEVKDLGIKMGVPVFQIQQLINQHQIKLFSSNYTLYADMSSRVMSTLEAFAPSMEVYSIDEAFLDLTGVCHQDTVTYGDLIRKTVVRATGIPVCVGMGPTKTLAKLANFAAKKWCKTGGVLDLSNLVRREKLMRIVPVGEVWGIGSRTTLKLKQLGIHSVWDLATQSSERIQSQFNIVVAKTVLELNGVSCFQLEEISANKQQIVCSRSFSRRLTEYKDLFEALAEFCSRAAEKLRRQHSVTGCISIFIRTSPFNIQEPQYQRSATIKLDTATQDTRTLITVANRLLKEIFKAGYGYQKCGVQLSQIHSASMPGQYDLFGFADNDLPAENRPLMATVDQINRRFPKAISIAATGFEQSWQPKSERISPRYTTDWRDLVCVK